MSAVLVGVLVMIIVLMIFNSEACASMMRRQRKVPKVSKCDAPNVSYMDGGEPVMHDYNDYLLTTGLEKGVIDSHRQFTNDIQVTSGASAQSVMSGDNYDVPFIGLRRPDLRVEVDPNARNVPSNYEGQYPQNTTYDRNGLF